jgi:hypothetical protein
MKYQSHHFLGLLPRLSFVFVSLVSCLVFIGTTSTTHATTNPQCLLSLTSQSSVTPENQINYSLVAKNIGTSQCISTQLSMYYDQNEAFVHANPNPTASNYYWNIGTLEIGKSAPITITTSIKNTQISSVANSACLSATGAADACNDITTQTSTSTQVGTSTPSEYGVWVWDSPFAMGTVKSNTVIDEASANGFKAIYITIDDYLDIMNMPNGSQKTKKLNKYNTALTSFITYAHQKGITVDAEAGWRDWVQPELRYKAYSILDFVNKFNVTHPNTTFRNVQYDVELYLLPEYETNKAAVLYNFIDMVNQLVIKNTSDLGITIVIPHFYDKTQNWTPLITYNGKTTATFTHILGILDTKPNNSITIMAYRDHAVGKDGTVELSQPEITEASLAPHRVKIYVAQETGNVTPDYVTFFGESKAKLASELGIITNTFGSSRAFGGISIHYLDSFLALPQ